MKNNKQKIIQDRKRAIKSSICRKLNSKHDKLNMHYINKMSNMEDILVNYEFFNYNKTRCEGEIDGFLYKKGKNNNIAYIIETKSSMSASGYIKALYQMERTEKKFVPRYEKKHNMYFDRIVHLYVNPSGIYCKKVTKK